MSHIAKHCCAPKYLHQVLKISLAKEPYKRDYILQKRPIILRSLLIVATQYVIVRVCVVTHWCDIIHLSIYVDVGGHDSCVCHMGWLRLVGSLKL